MRRQLRQIPPVVAVLGLLLAGCGGTPASSPTSSASAAPSSLATTPASPPGEPTKTTTSYDSGGVSRELDVYTPAGPDAGPFPAVILLHGGGFTGGDVSEVAGAAQEMARHGFVALTPAYALPTNPGYPGQLDDVLVVVDQVRARSAELRVDPDRVALFGSSAGANLAVLAVTARKAPVRAVVGWSGLYDMTLPGAETLGDLAGYLGCRPSQDAACRDGIATQASPAKQVRGPTPPIRLVNARDESMPVAQLDAMTSALQQVGAPVDRVLLDASGHAMSYGQIELGPTMDWLDRQLRS